MLLPILIILIITIMKIINKMNTNHIPDSILQEVGLEIRHMGNQNIHFKEIRI